MRGSIPSLPNTPSWSGAQLKQRGSYYIIIIIIIIIVVVVVRVTKYCGDQLKEGKMRVACSTHGKD
jgi:hypothetical protein